MKTLGQKLSAENQIKISDEINKYPITGEVLKMGLSKHYWIDLTVWEATTIHRALCPASEVFGISQLSNLFNS